MKASYLAEKFAAALPYNRYVATGTPEQQRRWKMMLDAVKLTPQQAERIALYRRDMKLLVISGVWCGDCVQQVPLIQRGAEANPARIDLRILDRDEHRDLIEPLRINTGDRVPVVLFLAEDHELCGVFGDRTLSRYRALAARQLGASCPLAIAPPERDEWAATLQDWLNEIERFQLLLQLSGRLRAKYGD